MYVIGQADLNLAGPVRITGIVALPLSLDYQGTRRVQSLGLAINYRTNI